MATPKTTLWDRDAHTAEKHALLRAYLNAWWPIMLQGRFPGATYAEGFAGPGEYTDGAEGSPVVAMRSRLEQPTALPRSPCRFAFVEEDERRCAHLNGVIRSRFPELPAHIDSPLIRRGPCGSALLPALDELAVWGKPIFAFLDPFNVAVPHQVVQRVGTNPSSEVLVTFMSDQLTRWAWNQDLVGGDVMFGDTDWRDVDEQPTSNKKRYLIDAYRQRLKRWGSPTGLPSSSSTNKATPSTSSSGPPA